MFVGYSFPPTDYHSQRIFHIARMERARNGKTPFEILYCGGQEDKETDLQSIFGKESKIVIKNKFTDLCGSKELDSFLNS